MLRRQPWDRDECIQRACPVFQEKAGSGYPPVLAAGEDETWEYPIRSFDPGVWYMGYASVGEVVETGKAVKGIKGGDIVACSAPHQEENVINAEDAVVLPKRYPAGKRHLAHQPDHGV